MKPSEFVAAVSEELQRNGWIQGTMRNDQGSCVLGAITSVALNNLGNVGGVRHPSFHEAKDFMEIRLQEMHWASIPAYNDWPGRTYNEVQDFLYRCQVGLKERE